MATISVSNEDDLQALVARLSDKLAISWSPQQDGSWIGTGSGAAIAAADGVDMTSARKDYLRAYAAARRYAKETAGVSVTIGGQAVPFSTERGDDRAALQSTYSAITTGVRPDPSMFKCADGVSRSISNADMLTAILAAFNAVQSAFDAEGAVQADVDSGTITAKAQIDAAFA